MTSGKGRRSEFMPTIYLYKYVDGGEVWYLVKSDDPRSRLMLDHLMRTPAIAPIDIEPLEHLALAHGWAVEIEKDGQQTTTKEV